jgi:small subunit ribosomal protein S15
MALTKEKKSEIISRFQQKQGDTGSPEVQIAIMTARVAEIAEHLKTHKKDLHCRRGLMMHLNGRRALLDYLKREDVARYQAVIQALGLRR